VKQGAVVSKRYTTVSMVRTIGAILGFDPLGINDATAEPMDDVFGMKASPWAFKAIIPDVLRTTSLPLPPPDNAKNQRKAGGVQWAAYDKPRRDAAYWEEKTRGFDFTVEDRIDSARFNRILWAGLKGENVPYPTVRDARDLSRNRELLLTLAAQAKLSGRKPEDRSAQH